MKAVKEQANRSKITKKPAVEYMNRSELNEFYANSIKKHAKAYKKLGK